MRFSCIQIASGFRGTLLGCFSWYDSFDVFIGGKERKKRLMLRFCRKWRFRWIWMFIQVEIESHIKRFQGNFHKRCLQAEKTKEFFGIFPFFSEKIRHFLWKFLNVETFQLCSCFHKFYGFELTKKWVMKTTDNHFNLVGIEPGQFLLLFSIIFVCGDIAHYSSFKSILSNSFWKSKQIS